MKHPVKFVSKWLQLRVWLYFGFLMGTLVCSALLQNIGQSLVTEKAPGGIVSFEFAGSGQKCEDILKSWGDHGRTKAMKSLRLDFLFIFFYVITLSYGCLMSARFFGAEPRRWGAISCTAYVLAWGQAVAGLLDVGENICLQLILKSYVPDAAIGDGLPGWAWVFALGKFVLLGLGSCLIVAAIVFSLERRDRST